MNKCLKRHTYVSFPECFILHRKFYRASISDWSTKNDNSISQVVNVFKDLSLEIVEGRAMDRLDLSIDSDAYRPNING